MKAALLSNVRSLCTDCDVIMSQNGTDRSICSYWSYLLQCKLKRKSRPKLKLPANLKTPVKGISVERVQLALKGARFQCISMNKEIKNMREELAKRSKTVNHDLEMDLSAIIESNANKMTPFMELFWEQQKLTSQKSETARRYHLTMIRRCLQYQSAQSLMLLMMRSFTDRGLLQVPRTEKLPKRNDHSLLFQSSCNPRVDCSVQRI